MKITIIRHSIRNRGGDKLLLDYSDFLLAKGGYDIVYWTNEIKTDFKLNPKIQIKRIPIPTIAGTILFACFKKFMIDVLIVDLVVMAFFCSFRNRNKILCMAQGYDLSYHKNPLLNVFIDFCYKRVLHDLAIPTIAVAQGLADQLQYYRPQKLIVIPNGVPLEKFYREEAPPLPLTQQKKFVIFFFARKDLVKGFDTAEAALQKLTKIRPQKDWEVWAIGNEDISFPDVSVKNLRFISDEKRLREILSATDIFLVPSRSEGLSILLLLALACECVIVSTAASTILSHEINGLVSPIEDADALANNMNRALNSPDLMLKLRKEARVLAGEYDWVKSCRSFEGVLKTHFAPAKT